jgi:hypothetical protein
MQYHYTDRYSAADILKARRIRAVAITLHKDIFRQGHGLTTPPLVWLTINPTTEPSVVFKLIQGGWPKGLVNDLWRFVLPADYAPMGLAEYSDKHQIDPSWWECVLRTGEVAGSDYTTWRCLSRHIPAQDWTAVEVLGGYTEEGVPVWKPAR